MNKSSKRRKEKEITSDEAITLSEQPSKNKYIDFKTNGRLFQLWIAKNFKKYKSLAKIKALTCILIVGLSRLYLSVHWFTDVIGGFLVGSFWLLVAIYFLERK